MKILTCLVAALTAVSLAAPADARPRDREQDAAYRGAQEGRIMPLRRIERQVVPRMEGSEYLGPELDARASTYRLKFMRNGRVIWVDVDARTGRVRGRSGQ